MEELYITLYDEDGKPLSYQVEQIFGVEGTDQLYCGAVPADGGDLVFLRCDLSEHGENTEVTISDIPNTAEYIRVTTAYQKIATRAAKEAAREELSAHEDFITLTDADGNEKDFIVHTIFDDDKSNLSYVAMQEVDDEGNVAEEISLYRFEEDGGNGMVDMIRSDMEYERAKKLFENLIETT